MTILRLVAAAVGLSVALGAQQWGGELRFCLRAEPRTFHPALVDEDASETVRYLTGGVLVRVNRVTQEFEPELAVSWKIENRGRTIVFRVREGVRFSDGAPFTPADVAYTMEMLMDPQLHSPTGDAFRSGAGSVKTALRGAREVAVTFPEPVASLPRLFDQVAILSRQSPLKERAVLGPFVVAEHKAGAYVRLARNPHYWKTDCGRRLPYLDGVRMDIQANREIELLRFRRGEIHLISALDPEQFEQVAREKKAWVRDAGPSLEGEMMWFNMNPAAPLAGPVKAWFASRNFRRALSHAIRREDLGRVVYRDHAQPAAGPFSAANRFWFNQHLKPHAFDLRLARELLAADGFRPGTPLRDREGRAVEFSLITNAGNRTRERAAAMIQQDLAALGITVHVVTLDFPSLIQRITKTFQYEACLLGLINVDLDPNGQMNVWLSSSANHQWNPGQKSPATPWEAEIDKLMRAQALALEPAARKKLFDRVQEIAWEQAPFLYLAYKNTLVAAAPDLKNLSPSVLRPSLLWNVDRLYLERR